MTPHPSPARAHQPGQEVFKAVLSEDIDWKPLRGLPAFGSLGHLQAFPPGSVTSHFHWAKSSQSVTQVTAGP